MRARAQDQTERARVQRLSNDAVAYVRQRALNMCVMCLSSRPEQEHNLLRLIVRKFGDPDRKVASKVVYLLTQLVQQHPRMAAVVVREVWQSVLGVSLEHAHTPLAARHYAVVFLAQVPLDQRQGDVADQLIAHYLSLFHTLAERRASADAATAAAGAAAAQKRPHKAAKGAVPGTAAPLTPEASQLDKMYAALLNGIHRALPYASLSADAYVRRLSARMPCLCVCVCVRARASSFDRELQAIYRLVHEGQFGMSLQALWLLYRLVTSKASAAASATGPRNRFYRAVYESLLDARLPRAAAPKQRHYLQLVQRVMLEDDVESRTAAFVKRLLQVRMRAHLRAGDL